MCVCVCVCVLTNITFIRIPSRINFWLFYPMKIIRDVLMVLLLENTITLKVS
jgi:hypothetical protein